VKNRGIKVCVVWPDQRMNLWIDLELVEKGWVLQRAIEFPLQHWAEVDELRDTVVEVYSQAERSYFFKDTTR
jgi:hypothetical protein